MFAKSFKLAMIAALILTFGFAATAAQAAPPAYNHDMSPYITLTKAAQKLVADGDLAGALKKAKELEEKWDNDTTDLKKADSALWNLIDKQMDVVIEALEAKDATKSAAELKGLLEKYDRVPKPKP
jgi:hypothetical protein